MKKVLGLVVLLVFASIPYLHILYEINYHAKHDKTTQEWKEGGLEVYEFTNRDGLTYENAEYVEGHYETKHSSNRLMIVFIVYMLLFPISVFFLGAMFIAKVFKIDWDNYKNDDDFSIATRSKLIPTLSGILMFSIFLLWPLTIILFLWLRFIDFI